MWVKLQDESYVDLATGATLDVAAKHDEATAVAQSWCVRVRSPLANRAMPSTLEEYPTEEEARGALDDLLSNVEGGVLVAQPPVTDEETDEETADVEQEKE